MDLLRLVVVDEEVAVLDLLRLVVLDEEVVVLDLLHLVVCFVPFRCLSALLITLSRWCLITLILTLDLQVKHHMLHLMTSSNGGCCFVVTSFTCNTTTNLLSRPIEFISSINIF